MRSEAWKLAPTTTCRSASPRGAAGQGADSIAEPPGRRPPADPTVWRPLAVCEELRNSGKGRLGRLAPAGVPPTCSLGAVLGGARESPRADLARGGDLAGRLQPHGGHEHQPHQDLRRDTF